MGVIRVAEKSAIQRIKELDAERVSIFEPCLSGWLQLMLPGGSSHRCRDFCT